MINRKAIITYSRTPYIPSTYLPVIIYSVHYLVPSTYCGPNLVPFGFGHSSQFSILNSQLSQLCLLPSPSPSLLRSSIVTTNRFNCVLHSSIPPSSIPPSIDPPLSPLILLSSYPRPSSLVSRPTAIPPTPCRLATTRFFFLRLRIRYPPTLQPSPIQPRGLQAQNPSPLLNSTVKTPTRLSRQIRSRVLDSSHYNSCHYRSLHTPLRPLLPRATNHPPRPPQSLAPVTAFHTSSDQIPATLADHLPTFSNFCTNVVTHLNPNPEF